MVYPDRVKRPPPKEPYDPGVTPPPPGRGLRALARIRRSRARGRRAIGMATIGTVVCVGAIVAMIGLRPSPPGPVAVAPAGSGSPSGASSPGAGSPGAHWPVTVTLRGGAVYLDGVEIARTEAIAESNRLTKVDALFTALKERRFEHPGEPASVVFDVSSDTPAMVVKSAFQTVHFAGIQDVQFLVPPVAPSASDPAPDTVPPR